MFSFVVSFVSYLHNFLFVDLPLGLKGPLTMGASRY